MASDVIDPQPRHGGGAAVEAGALIAEEAGRRTRALVGGSLQALDQQTQQNTALVEQTAAAAQSLHDQANALAEEVSRFRLP